MEALALQPLSPPDDARRAQSAWMEVPVARRLRIVRRFRHEIADRLEELVDAVTLPGRGSRAETVSAEILPLADACRFLEREARRRLADRREGRRGRPFWLGGSDVVVRREPLGVVLVIGPANYPLLLPGVQALQALVAGNAVLLKPGRGARRAAEALARLLRDAGLPEGLLTVLDESPDAARRAIRGGVAKVFLTGSVETGRDVMRELAPELTPSVMELSGCDAVFVRADADLDLAARALRFGMTLNAGFTCIAPRRVFVARERAADLERKLSALLAAVEPLRLDADAARLVSRVVEDALGRGARVATGGVRGTETMAPLVLADVDPDSTVMRADIAAPLVALTPVDDDDHALALARACDYELGATIFGGVREARSLATRVPAGIVVINDMIVPTADPRVPFGGRGASGFGVTRGAEGLLEMTRVKTVIRRRGSFRPHLDPVGPREEALLPAFVRVAHAGTVRARVRAAIDIVKTLTR